jgi:hypothetical protein
MLTSSDLDYVNVQSGRLLDMPAGGSVRASLYRRGLKPTMTREVLAEFMVQQLTATNGCDNR